MAASLHHVSEIAAFCDESLTLVQHRTIKRRPRANIVSG
jgi:hypothetical protein